MQLAALGLEYMEMPIKKAKDTFYKRADRDRFEKYFVALFQVMQQAATKS